MPTLEKNLNKLQTFVDELQSTSSSNSKKETLKKYSNDHFITKVLRYTFDSFKKYNVTPGSSPRKDQIFVRILVMYDLFYLLDALDITERLQGIVLSQQSMALYTHCVDNHKRTYLQYHQSEY